MIISKDTPAFSRKNRKISKTLSHGSNSFTPPSALTEWGVHVLLKRFVFPKKRSRIWAVVVVTRSRKSLKRTWSSCKRTTFQGQQFLCCARYKGDLFHDFETIIFHLRYNVCIHIAVFLFLKNVWWILFLPSENLLMSFRLPEAWCVRTGAAFIFLQMWWTTERVPEWNVRDTCCVAPRRVSGCHHGKFTFESDLCIVKIFLESFCA